MVRIVLFHVLAVVLLGCNQSKKGEIFAIRNGGQTGIDFQNSITTNDSVNALTFEYIYNGSGVGIGDFNKDGLEDIFFGGNDVSSELYLNSGNLQFKKTTRESGVQTDRWVTGVSVVDINTDGLDDIYLSVGGKTGPENRKNILFINKGVKNGVPVFEEQAKKYGLDDDSYSTMAAFFDYDKDGDLDMYLLNNWLEQFNRNNLRVKRVNGEAESTDKLYRNNGDNTFTNVSREAGILVEGYGLGVNITDINHDSWPDVYVANDFMSNDLLWINNRDGTFSNKIGDYLKHQTHNGMGVDIADFNNDALQDIVVVDMLPPGHERQKLMTPGQNYDHFHLSLTMDYQPQYMRNTLQLNRGKDAEGNMTFSEIAFLSEVAQTDWSWAPLFADFDNDGRKDLFIANGYRKDVTHLDFIFFGFKNLTPFGTTQTRKTITQNEFNKIKDVKLANCFFRNSGSLVFEDKTAEWCEALPTFTNGTAYADFDNDGDLDLVTNNIDQEVLIYENLINKTANYLKLDRDEDAGNEKIFVYSGGEKQFQEYTPYRGFQSTVSSVTHFGLGKVKAVDSVIIEWPDNSVAKFYNVKPNTTLSYRKSDAKTKSAPASAGPGTLFRQEHKFTWKHAEKSPSDIKVTRTLMHELGNYGPCYARGDVNNDGLDDFYFGREAGDPAQVYIQQNDGTFEAKSIPATAPSEDGAALFFDADIDGDDDLYVAGACSSGFTKAGAHALYLNDGRGNFSFGNGRIPEIHVSSLTVNASDIDQDGDLDLFVGGHLKPGEYPRSDRSYLLLNQNGVFQDATESMAQELLRGGLVTTSVWTDVNKDNKPDLVIAGEWMPVRVFLNNGAKFSEESETLGFAGTDGWWNVLKSADLNNDGYPEIIAGNTGKNSFFKPTSENPLILAFADLDNNGAIDPILTYFNPVENERFIVHNRLVLIDQIPGVKRRMQTFTQYATTPFEKVFTEEELAKTSRLQANTLISVVFRNHKGSFTTEALPDIAQVSTLNDVIADDLNADGLTDLILVGNNYCQETLFGRYDASVGTILINDGNAGWKVVGHEETGFTADGDVRRATTYAAQSGKRYLILRNNDNLSIYKGMFKTASTSENLISKSK